MSQQGEQIHANTHENQNKGYRPRLERRYRKLLRAYPASYRAERGDEIVGTYLELTGTDRRWPRIGDVYDALRGGMRARTRDSAAAGVGAGVPVAARYALSAAVVLAAVWLLRIELRAVPEGYLIRAFGPFQTLGAIAWIGWLTAGVAAVLLPRPIARGFVVTALVTTVAVIPAAALLPYERPPLQVLLPELALGIVALGWPGPPRRTRPLIAVTATGTAIAIGIAIASRTATASGTAIPVGFSTYGYWQLAGIVLICAAAALLVGSIVGGLVGTISGDGRGWSAALILLVPTALLIPPRLVPRPMVLVRSGALPTDDRLMLATITASTTIIALGILLLALTVRRRRFRQPTRHGPACGTPRPTPSTTATRKA